MDHFKKIIETNDLPHKIVDFERNEFIKSPHTVDTNLYIILSGSVRVYTVNENMEQCLYFGFQGSFITAVDSFFSEDSSNYIIQPIKRTKIKIIKKHDFMEFVNSEKEYMELWQNILVEIIQHHVERGHDLMTNNSVERYERLFHRAPYLFQEIPHKYIASYLRMSPETLSRLQKS